MFSFNRRPTCTNKKGNCQNTCFLQLLISVYFTADTSVFVTNIQTILYLCPRSLMFFWPCIMKWLYINYQLMHWLLFIHRILFFPTCFVPQVLIFRRIELYTCSIWYCHSLWEFLVACRYTAWVRTDCRGKVGGCLKTVLRNAVSLVTHTLP